MAAVQNIVIIGASHAGASLANELTPNLPGTHRILLIDVLDFAFWPIASLRAAVVPGWEKRVTTKLSQEALFPSGSINRVIAPNKVVELRKTSIVLEKPFEGSNEVPFFKCVIATGAQQPAPMRPAPGSSEEAYISDLTTSQKQLSESKKILVVGAGAVGLEVAGDIRGRFPDKSITIVHSESHVLNPTAGIPDRKAGHFSYSSPPTAIKLSEAIEAQLKTLKVDLITNDRVIIPDDPSGVSGGAWNGTMGAQNGTMAKVSLKSGKVIEADYVFLGVGNKPNIQLVEKVDKGAIVADLVGVNEYLKVISKTTDSLLTDNYYAIGDCCSAPGWKTAQGAAAEASGCAVNLLADIKKKPLKAYTRPKPYAMFIPLGTTGGAGSMDMPLLGTVTVPTFLVKTAKGKALFVEQLFFGRFKGFKKPQAPPIPAAA